MRAAPPAEWADAYRSMSVVHGPPPAAEVAAAPVGVKVYPDPPEGCYWASGRLFWRVRAGDVVLRVLGVEDAYNGHRPVRAAVVDMASPLSQARLSIPFTSLSRDLEMLPGRWVAVRIRRDGRRRPWNAMPIPRGPLVEAARQLNES